MSNPNTLKDGDKVTQLIDAAKPILQKLTFSSFMGYCGGITAKKVGKGMAIVIGVTFFGLQGLAYKGLIDIDWKKVQSSAVSTIDTVSSLVVLLVTGMCISLFVAVHPPNS
jgi:uncharacterized membrane protein (Fun14 family)